MKFRKILMVMAAATVIMTASCTMKQDIYIDSEGAGRVSVDLSLADYLTEVVNQLQGVMDPDNPRPEDAPLFETDAIAAGFEDRDGVTLEQIESPSPNAISGSFLFDDVNALYQKVEEGSVESRLISLEESGDARLMTVTVNRETIEALLEENPALNNPLVVNFGPTSNQGITDEDYLSMMEIALGAESRQGILDSSLELRVNVEGTVLSQEGGVLVDESTVLYEIPLLPVLMLREPLIYTLRYR